MIDISVVYRNDGRTLSKIKETGFASWNQEWNARDVVHARIFLKFFLDRTVDTSSLPEPAKRLLKPTKSVVTQQDVYPKFLDVMANIKTTLKGNDAFWVSTAINKDAGGRSEGHLYKVQLPSVLKLYRIADGKLQPATQASAVNPALYLDAGDLDTAKVFAFVSGPNWDSELSFFTKLESAWISES